MTMNINANAVMVINAVAMAAVVVGGFATVVTIIIKDVVSFVRKRI